MKQEHSAGFLMYCIKDFQGQLIRHYLLLQYRGGYWDLPKGKIEPGETLMDTALREAQEETGLTVDPLEGFSEELHYVFTSQAGEIVNKTVTFFVGHVRSDEVTLSHEHQDYAWLPYKQALAQLTYKNAQIVLKASEQFLQNREM